MSQQANTDVLHEMFAAFQRGDLDQVLAALADDVEWWAAGPPEAPYAGAYHGRDGVRRFLDIVEGAIDYERWEPRQFIAQGDDVVVVGHERGCAKATGKCADNPWVMVFEMRNGKVQRFRNFEDTAAVLAAMQGG